MEMSQYVRRHDQGGGGDALPLTASLEALKGKDTPAYLLGKAGKKQGGEVQAASLIAKTGIYHAQVQERVREQDPAQPLFLLANIYHPNRDKRRSSLTRIMPKNEIEASREKAAAAMKELHCDRPSRDKKRAYQLQYYTLSELVSDLWWVNKKEVNRKVLKKGQ